MFHATEHRQALVWGLNLARVDVRNLHRRLVVSVDAECGVAWQQISASPVLPQHKKSGTRCRRSCKHTVFGVNPPNLSFVIYCVPCQMIGPGDNPKNHICKVSQALMIMQSIKFKLEIADGRLLVFGHMCIRAPGVIVAS